LVPACLACPDTLGTCPDKPGHPCGTRLDLEVDLDFRSAAQRLWLSPE